MTEEDIAELGVPYTTLQDWKKPSNKRHPLYRLLTNLDRDEAEKLLNKGSVHRLQHVLNRNISKELKYSYKEIQGAFENTHYEQLNKRQQNVIDLFFKECDTDDVKSLNDFFKIPRGNLKKLYSEAISLRKIEGVAKVWDRKFRLKKLPKKTPVTVKHIPPALEKVLSKRTVAVHV
jgi:hypothetical protein